MCQKFSPVDICLVLLTVCSDMSNVVYQGWRIFLWDILTLINTYIVSDSTFIVLVVVFLPGELAKYDMLHEAIVHKCIKQVKNV